MCDLSDVEIALVGLVVDAVYPQGIAVSSVVGVPVAAYRGWPSATSLDLDLTGPATKPAGWTPTANVTVFPINGMTRDTTRFERRWVADGPSATTLTAVASGGTTVTISGASGVAQLVGIRSSGVAHVYPASATDTPETTAAALAAMVPGASVAGAIITLPFDRKLAARVGGYSTIRRELRRQVQGLRITVWAPDRASRDAIAKAIDAAIAGHTFLQLPDGPGRLRYVAADVDDVPIKAAIWKRDFRITVEYPTTESKVAPAMMWGVVQQSTDAVQDADVAV